MPTEGVTLLHVPPAAASVNAVFAPAQTRAVPVIVPGLGDGLTVTTLDAASVPQLLVIVYEILVVPAEMPVTTPNASTVPLAGFTLLHTPPAAASERVVVAPTQTVNVPSTAVAFGNGLTVTILVAVAVPQLLVTV